MALAGREKSMGFVWFVVASLFAVIVLWMMYDEGIGRRTWKHYAAQWERLETVRINKAIDEAKKQIDPERIKKIHLQLEEAEQALLSKEHKALVDLVEQAKLKDSDAKEKLQFTKADLDEAFYYFKHAQQTGRDFSHEKAEFDRLSAKADELAKIADQHEKALGEVQARAAVYTDRINALQAEEAELMKTVVQLNKQLDAVKDRGAPIDQYVLDGLGRAGATQWGTVDRCTSCHIAELKTGYEDQAEPFKTHPHLKEIFDAHPVEQYGCVTCHGGQGRATQIKGKPMEEGDFPHGFERHWLNPLLRGDFVQSSCNKCHVQQWNLDLAPVYTEGKHLFVNLGCINCHKIKGLDWAPKVAPNLGKIKDKVFPEWMFAWIKKPTNYLPKSKMPQAPWQNDQEVIQAMSYLLDKSEAFDWPYGNFPGGNATQGEQTFNKVGCIACHAVGDKGGDVAPALDRIGEKTTPNWVYNWIQNPRAWSHAAKMPSLRLSKEEAANVTAYLMRNAAAPAVDEKLRAALTDPNNIKEGFRVINSYGCYACHEIKGFESFSRPSVDLSNFGRKDVHELAFGDAKIPQTWLAWTTGKITNPQMFLDERSSSIMPLFNISEAQIKSLVVFLKGQMPEELPQKYIAYDPEIEAGRQVINRYNCTTCHLIEGKGGTVGQWIEDPNFLPPNLASAGMRLQTQWMHGFLKNPGNYHKTRPWLDIRMPNFQLSDDELTALVKYFKKSAGVDSLFEQVDLSMSPENLVAAEQLVSPQYLNCYLCHIKGNQYPEAGPSLYAPNLVYAYQRLRPQWLNLWLRNPQALISDARMPPFYPVEGSGPKEIFDGNDEKQIRALLEYVMTLGKRMGYTSLVGKSEAPSATATTGGSSTIEK